MKSDIVSVTVRRRFRVPAERVFDAWLDPDKGRQFLFVKPGQHIVRAEIDARVGGSFLLVARRDGQDIDHIGTYLEIDRPRRLVFDFAVPSVFPQKGRVTIEIAAREPGCELTLTHDELPTSLADKVFGGWTTMLEGLQTTQFGPGDPADRNPTPPDTGCAGTVRRPA